MDQMPPPPAGAPVTDTMESQQQQMQQQTQADANANAEQMHVQQGSDDPAAYPVEVDNDANEHSLPTPAELPSHSRNNRPNLIIVLALCVLLLAAIVGLTLGLTLPGAGGSSSRSTNAENTEESKRERALRIQKYILGQGVSNDEDFVASRSAQNRAVKWLAETDPAQLDVPSGDINSAEGHKFISRYAMVVLYHTTNGPAWNFQLAFLSEHDVCDWFYIFDKPIGKTGVLCDSSRRVKGISFIFNNLSGPLPDELGHITDMTYMESIGNLISGPVPDTFRKLTRLTTFVFPHNRLTGPIPTWISEWSNLRFLYFSDNIMDGPIPTGLKELKQLEVMGLDDNSFTGTLGWIWELPKLRLAYLEDNGFTGSLETGISTSSSNLEILDISSNQLSDPLPRFVLDLPNLRILDLHDNNLDNALLMPTKPNESLEFLALHGNSFSSKIPSTISNLKALTHLDLSYNEITGELPETFGQLSLLTYLFVAENPLTEGELPSWTYTFDKLRELSWKNTNRNGRIPADKLALLNKLVLLDLDDNGLTGPIPSTIGLLADLQFLLLNRNNFTNPIPQQIEQLDKLRFLFLDRTSVSGNITSMCQKTTFNLAFVDCQEVTCDCCSCCFDQSDTCHDHEYAANLNPLWEGDYERDDFYSFNTTF